MPKNLKLFLTLIIISTIALSIFSIFKKTQQHEITVIIPHQGIEANNIGILVKKGDRLSLKVAETYRIQRGVPKANVFFIKLPDSDNVPSKAFKKAYDDLIKTVPSNIQGFVTTWQTPYRVDCMSITSALAFGFDRKWCKPKKKGCHPTAISPYFNSQAKRPWQSFQMRPTMSLTGENLEEIEALIARGIKSDGSRPKAKAVLMRTKDPKRSSRWPIFKDFSERFVYHPLLDVFYIDGSQKETKDYIEQQNNILIYETGLVKVPNIDSNEYLPGAVADHLTSFGGKGFSRSGQMKVFRWLEAGVTGSYGTVVEPCNFPAKFPNPAVMIPNYLNGDTLLEAYWKSVKQPGEGLFVGEPLARPYDLHSISYLGGHLKILTNRLNPQKRYQLLKWDSETNQYQQTSARFIKTSHNTTIISAKNTDSKKFKVVETP